MGVRRIRRPAILRRNDPGVTATLGGMVLDIRLIGRTPRIQSTVCKMFVNVILLKVNHAAWHCEQLQS